MTLKEKVEKINKLSNEIMDIFHEMAINDKQHKTKVHLLARSCATDILECAMVEDGSGCPLCQG